MLVPPVLPRLPVPSVLLRLLLCLCLVANATAGAWASVGMAAAMALPAAAAPMAGAQPAPPCHDMGAPVAGHDAHTDAPGAPHDGHPGGCKHPGCDCLQHCNAALALLPAFAAGARRQAALVATLTAGRASPVPEQPVRPPIG